MVRLHTGERGVTYVALLFALAFVSSVLAATATIWSQAQQREREKQLLWTGDQFRLALAAYARAGNGTYPRELEELLEDTRGPAKRRFLRQIYEDPMTRSTDWGLIRNPLGGVIGVHSRSETMPIKTAQFPERYQRFESARSYADWEFRAVPRTRLEEQKQTPPGSQGTAGGPSPELPATTETRAAATVSASNAAAHATVNTGR